MDQYYDIRECEKGVYNRKQKSKVYEMSLNRVNRIKHPSLSSSTGIVSDHVLSTSNTYTSIAAKLSLYNRCYFTHCYRYSSYYTHLMSDTIQVMFHIASYNWSDPCNLPDPRPCAMQRIVPQLGDRLGPSPSYLQHPNPYGIRTQDLWVGTSQAQPD